MRLWSAKDSRPYSCTRAFTARIPVAEFGSDGGLAGARRDPRSHKSGFDCAALKETVGRIQQAGADFVLSVSQVARQLLAHRVLGEMVSQQARIKLAAGRLAGRHPQESRIRKRTDCTVIAVERAGEAVMDMPPSFALEQSDALYVCGTVDAFERFYEECAEAPA